MIIHPRAKINLGLNIVEKRPDGYHNLETVFYPINIHDTLEVEPSDQLNLHLSGVALEGDPNQNLVVRAWQLLKKDYDIPPVSIRLNKAIPSQAGLGGGSSDGAFMLRLLNKMFQLGISDKELRMKAASLGADCPFFITDTPAYAEGIGEILSPLSL
ncbi:MAG: 4-(cytidine 5'-diphospho)-2-C-methyl-D-erythritol kinase, partial [Prevotella sp.]|nr:4-(cytidine 5'-diphospho)-2-C-methyl-D-erythritol kinase [Prevotella sp.]